MPLGRTFKLALARAMNGYNMRRIRNAEEHSVRVKYMKNNGEEIDREVQPYEIKPHRTTGRLMVYVTDDAGGPGQIKSYIANRVRTVSKPLETFKPEWPVKL